MTRSCEQALIPEVTVAETISDLCTDYVAGSIINVAFNLQEIIHNVHTQSYNRAFTLAVSCTYQSFQIYFLSMMPWQLMIQT